MVPSPMIVLQAFRFELAALYEVPIEYISLEGIEAGSIQIEIKIAPPPASSSSSSASSSSASAAAAFDASSVLRRVASINASVLSTAIGMQVAVDEAPKVQNTTVVTVTQVARIVKIQCPPGFYCAAGVHTPCPVNFYNPLIDQSDGNACNKCPLYSHTEAEASIRLDQCICDNGFSRVNTSDGALSRGSTPEATVSSRKTFAGMPPLPPVHRHCRRPSLTPNSSQLTRLYLYTLGLSLQGPSRVSARPATRL